jgi:hypothetical protein
MNVKVFSRKIRACGHSGRWRNAAHQNGRFGKPETVQRSWSVARVGTHHLTGKPARRSGQQGCQVAQGLKNMLIRIKEEQNCCLER